MKVLIIGLDGATWDVLDDFVLTNYMPNLNRLKTGGCSGILQSTEPPITPAAWTTCITGCQPYTHGVLGFKDFNCENDCLSISSSASCTVPTMFEELSRQGYEVASINVPWTYPCRKINGIMVAGYGLPGTNVEFTYPPEFKEELLGKISDYDVLADWQENGKDDNVPLRLSSQDEAAGEQFEKNIAAIEKKFEQRLETAKIINGKLNCDILMVQFQNIDLIQHHIWSALDKKTRDNYSQKRDRIFSMFKKLDDTIVGLLELADEQTTVAVASDHGFGPMKAAVRVNKLLHQWGYLKYKSPLGSLIRKLKRSMPGQKQKNKSHISIELKTPVDWKHSKAMVMYASMNGHIYLNVKGRNPTGAVEPNCEYDKCLDDLKERFSSVTCPVTGKRIFGKIATPAELYGTQKAKAEKLGDLIVVPEPGYIVHQSTSRKGPVFKYTNTDSPPGCHYSSGIYIFYGPGIKKGVEKKAHIVDFAPTIYAAAGAKLPNYMDGKVMAEVFSKDIRIEYISDETQRGRAQKQSLSEEEQHIIQQKLAQLGYMD